MAVAVSYFFPLWTGTARSSQQCDVFPWICSRQSSPLRFPIVPSTDRARNPNTERSGSLHALRITGHIERADESSSCRSRRPTPPAAAAVSRTIHQQNIANSSCSKGSCQDSSNKKAGKSRRCESEPRRRRLMSFKGLDATGRVLQQSVGAIRATTRTGPNDCLNQSYPVGDSVNPERRGFSGGAARDRCIPCGPVAENATTGL